MQPDKSFDLKGEWVRWSRYDLLNGVVVPADGAELQEYDPWDAFRANAGKYRTVQQPYTALLDLYRHLKEAESKGIRPSYTLVHPRHLPEPIIGPRTEADELILVWCNGHGLLGLVPVLSNSICLPATNEPGNDEHTRIIKKRHYLRDGGIWSLRVKIANCTGTTRQGAEASARRFADKGPKPDVTWLNWLTRIYERKPLKDVELFFRPVWKDEPLLPPCPNTRQFWECYGEPIQQFVKWCEVFALSVDYMSRWETGKANGEDAARTVQQSHLALSGLAQAAAPSFRFNPKRNIVEEVRESAGLLASYALMFLWDRIEGRRALRCQNCQAYFVSDEQRARYCSPRCRNTAQSRRYRSRKETGK